MKQYHTQGIVLSRINYGEADRIISILTPDNGKLRLIAHGVRRAKSKLAGGIELFCVSDVGFIRGRGEIGTLSSARLIKHYGTHVIKDIKRVQLGYSLIKMLDKVTEDMPEPEYFRILELAFVALNDLAIDEEVISLWFRAQLLRQAGYTPNLHSDNTGKKLQVAEHYNFEFETMSFIPDQTGKFNAGDIKFLRLLFSDTQPKVLSKVTHYSTFLDSLVPITHSMARDFLRIDS
jgi:DNA repair protein RecO